ncbi:Succinyl-CoA:(R)-benzylsuccinate CoA-transferase subunit BbsF [subsurface metagenome]
MEFFEEASAWRVPVGIVNDTAKLFHDPQHRARGFFIPVEHPLLGKVEYAGHPFIMSETPWRVSRAPLLGEHNRDILIGRLGYSEKELAMAEDGAI